MFCKSKNRKETGYDIRAIAHNTAFPGLGGGAQRVLARSKLDYKCCLASLRRNSAREQKEIPDPER